MLPEKKRVRGLGADEVFDFRVGDPHVPAPPAVNEAIRALLLECDGTALHGYTPAPGLPSLRKAVAAELRARCGALVSADGVYVCCGAEAGLAACCRGLLCPGEEALVFAPFSPEYRAFVEGAGGELGVVPAAGGLAPDLEALEQRLGERTKLLILNTPNACSGVAFPAESLARIGELLQAAERRFNRTIYLVADESCRELVYDGALPPSALGFYDDAILCASFSLPGERIGCLAVSDRAAQKADVFDALAGAARAIGYVNPPSLMQRVVERCLGQRPDLSVWRESRDLLCTGLAELGFDCVRPDAAFYLFIKSPEPDAGAFSERAKQYGLLLTAGDEFGLGGYARLACCIPTDRIRRSMPAFRALAESYGL